MNYSGELYCQYANAYVKCSDKKCIECSYYQQTMQKKKSNKKNKGD